MGNSNIIMYTTEDGLTKIETTFDEDTVWLSIDQMAELFQRDKSTISRHIKNIFEEGELQRNSVVANFATTASDGKTYQVDYYNLDVIISVGYRVKSHRGTQFRIWAMGILKEYMKKGFALDDDRLKRLGGGNYFDELLARIRDIRSSEKVFWRKVLEIYATSIDYDPHAESSVLFFKQVQNKMHFHSVDDRIQTHHVPVVMNVHPDNLLYQMNHCNHHYHLLVRCNHQTNLKMKYQIRYLQKIRLHLSCCSLQPLL